MKKLLASLLLALGLLFPQPATSQFSGCSAGFCSPDDGTDSIPVSNACSTSSGTTITFTAQGIGNARPNRISVVTINWDDSTVAGTAELNAVTIGGISMLRAVRAAGDNQNSNSEIWYVANPTGTSANVVLTFSTAVDGVTIEVYSLIGYDTVLASTTGTTSVTQAYDNKQLAIATASRRINVSTSLSNMTNDFSSACGANLWGVHASQKLNGNNGSLTSTISPTSNTPLIALAKWSVGGVLTCSDATTFLARTSGLDTAHRNAYSNLICGLVSDGVWSKLIVMYVFATQNTTTALLNLVSVGAPITVGGAPTFTTDRGYTGVESSTSVYLDTTFVPPSGVFTTNNAHASIWSNSSGQTAGVSMGLGGVAVNTTVQLISRYTDNHIDFRLNSTVAAGPTTATTTDGRGFILANKDSGTTLTGYKNGAVVLGPVADTTGAPWGGQILILAANASPGTAVLGSATQVSAATLGGALTGADVANLYNRLSGYMLAVGVLP